MQRSISLIGEKTAQRRPACLRHLGGHFLTAFMPSRNVAVVCLLPRYLEFSLFNMGADRIKKNHFAFKIYIPSENLSTFICLPIKLYIGKDNVFLYDEFEFKVTLFNEIE